MSKITANEAAIGITTPPAAVEIYRQRLTPAGSNRAVVIADVFPPQETVTAVVAGHAAYRALVAAQPQAARWGFAQLAAIGMPTRLPGRGRDSSEECGSS